MKLPTILQVVFALFYVLWVFVLFASMPPHGVLETIGVLVFAALVFVAAYFFYLFVFRAVAKATRRKSDQG